MIRRYVFSGVLAMACAGTVAMAQMPAETQNPTQAQPITEAAPSADQPADPAPTTKLMGCLYKERDVPGREPNIAERAGVLEDYILAEAAESAPADPAAQPESGAVGTSGTTPAAGKMYKVELIADDQLSKFVGKRVEVTGRIDAESDDVSGTSGSAVPAPDKGPGPDQIDLPEFEAASIKAMPGACPPTP
jgi:hypothetical protein